MTTDEVAMTQTAPYPQSLRYLVDRVKYRPGWKFHLTHMDRGQGSEGLTLDIVTLGYDSYHPERGESYRVHHYMPVPAAAYGDESWQRWLFDQCLLVERHEAMEFFSLRDASTQPDDRCTCGHPASEHDGRQSSCSGCAGSKHRFQAETPRYCKPYAPNHGHGEDPYIVHDPTTGEARRTSFRNVVDDDGSGHGKPATAGKA